MPFFPGDSPDLTVDALLKQPDIIARGLTSLAAKRYVADRVFFHGSPESAAGGGVRYQTSESIFTDLDAQEVAILSEFPRTGWSEAISTALVKKYGLEVPIPFETIRRNQRDVVARALIKIANTVVKKVDAVAMALLYSGAGQTTTATADWTTTTTDVVADIAKARKLFSTSDEGYVMDTMVIHPDQEQDLLSNPTIRAALPRESAGQLESGVASTLLGLKQIIVTPRATAATILFLQSNFCGTIVDEAVMPDEGYSSFSPGDDHPVILTKVYDETNHDGRVIRGVRFPVMWISEPNAIVKMTGA